MFLGSPLCVYLTSQVVMMAPFNPGSFQVGPGPTLFQEMLTRTRPPKQFEAKWELLITFVTSHQQMLMVKMLLKFFVF